VAGEGCGTRACAPSHNSLGSLDPPCGLRHHYSGLGVGGNVDLQPLAVAGQETSPEAASAILRRISYICRYATQDTTALLKTPLDSPLEAHLWKLREQARDLALERGQKRVERVADGFGYGGDILTHSRAWGSSFSRLRDERAQFVGIERELDRLEWRFAEVGWTTGAKLRQ